MMKSDQYIEVIQQRVIPDMQKAFSSGNGIFQQDLASCHSSKKVKKIFSDHSISVPDWPGNSPDLNPIENLWAIIKEHDCTTMTKLIEATVSVRYRDQEIKNMCEKLVISMPERIRQVIKSKGGHINY